MTKIGTAKRFKLFPEGSYVFHIDKIKYDDKFEVIDFKLTADNGQVLEQRFNLDTQRFGFSLLACAAMGIDMDDVDEVDTDDLVGRSFSADVVHNEGVSKKGKNRTYANLKNYSPVDNANINLDDVLGI